MKCGNTECENHQGMNGCTIEFEDKCKAFIPESEQAADESFGQSSGSVLYSCKICGWKPEQSSDDRWQYKCQCGTSGAFAETEEQSKEYWNLISFCPNWKAQNTPIKH